MKRTLALFLIFLLLVGCGRKEEPIHDEPVLVEPGIYTLSDGTVIDLWKTELFADLIYQTADGIELLRLREPVDIANVHVGNMIPFTELNEDV